MKISTNSTNTGTQLVSNQATNTGTQLVSNQATNTGAQLVSNQAVCGPWSLLSAVLRGVVFLPLNKGYICTLLTKNLLSIVVCDHCTTAYFLPKGGGRGKEGNKKGEEAMREIMKVVSFTHSPAAITGEALRMVGFT